MTTVTGGRFSREEGGENLFKAEEVEENEQAPSQADQAFPLAPFQGPRDHLSRGPDAGGASGGSRHKGPFSVLRDAVERG